MSNAIANVTGTGQRRMENHTDAAGVSVDEQR